jgi:Leucine-rich repeat (LRR) protein
VIDLSDNPIVVFPSFWICLSMSRILLHHTQISEIPSGVSQLHSLKYLDLSWCRLIEIVEHISTIPALKEIRLSGNLFEKGSITLNFPVTCTHVVLYGACLSSLKFQSDAKRILHDSAKQDLVKRFGKNLLRKTQENTRVIQGHIYRDEHLSDIELMRVNEAKVDSLRSKLGLTRNTESSTSAMSTSAIPSPQTTPAIVPKRSTFIGIRLNPIIHFAGFSIYISHFCSQN